MKHVRAITIDLDDTLWPIQPVLTLAEQAVHRWLDENCPRVSEAYSIADLRKRRQDYAARQCHLAHDLTAIRLGFLTELLSEHGYDPTLAHDAFAVFLSERNRVSLYPDTRTALESLKRSFPLASISNGNADLRLIGLDRFFVGHVAARDVGAAKPEPEIFFSACHKLGCAPEHTAHIGDHPRQDILGAAAVGMTTIWMNRSREAWPDTQRPDAEVASLSEVVALLSPIH